MIFHGGVTWKRESNFTVVASVSLLLACTPPSGDRPVRTGACEDRHHDASALRVVRVCTEADLRAGTPVSRFAILSTLKWDERSIPGVVADGHPLRWSLYQGEREWLPPLPSDRPRLAYFASRLGWFGPTALAQPEILTRSMMAGQSAWIAGFELPEQISAPAFHSVPASIKRVRILGPVGAEDLPIGERLLRVAAPKGDYRGFCGGPVAVGNERGDAHVVAIVLWQEPADGDADESILVACCIPEAFLQEGK